MISQRIEQQTVLNCLLITAQGTFLRYMRASLPLVPSSQVGKSFHSLSIEMTSAVPVLLVAPKPVRNSLVSCLPDKQPNLFLCPAASGTDSGEGLLVAKEIAQLVQTRELARPAAGLGSAQNRRQGQREPQPPRRQANPMLNDLAFREIEEKAGDFPWD